MGIQKPLAGTKILTFLMWPFPGRNGACRRFATFVRWLSDSGAEVTLALPRPGISTSIGNIKLAYFDRPSVIDAEEAAYQSVRDNPFFEGFSRIEIIFFLYHLSSYWHEDQHLINWLDEMIRSVDVVTWEYTFGVEVIAPICRKYGKPLIVTTYDHLARLHCKHPKAIQLLEASEVRALKLADASFTVSHQDQEAFRRLGIETRVCINVGDVNQVLPRGGLESFVRHKLKLSARPICLFSGSSHEPNNDAAEQIRTISGLVPEVEFIVAGTCAQKTLRDNFTSLGEVDDYLYQALHQAADLILIPLRFGGGSSLKFFDALSYGKCIVTTAVGARGHAITPGVHVVLCETVQEFVDEIRRLLSDKTARDAIGSAARHYAVAHDVWNEFSPYVPIIQKLTGKPVTTALTCRQQARKLFLCDNNLRDNIGHHFTYAETVAAECRARNTPFKALVRKDCEADILAALDGIPVFSHSYHEPVSRPLPFTPGFAHLGCNWDLIQSNIISYREIASVIRERVSPDDVIFFPNAHYRTLLAVAMLINEYTHFFSPTFVCMLRYPLYWPGTDNEGNPALCVHNELLSNTKTVFSELEKVASPTSLRIVTDSQQLADEYQPYTTIPIEVLPIPHTSNTIHVVQDAGFIPSKNRSIRIVTLGDARREKGFDLLPGIIRNVQRRLKQNECEFILHGYISSPYHNDMIPMLGELRNMGPSVHLLERPLEVHEYRMLLESADIVLIPYNGFSYKSRTSGPFIEAICAGKVVVVTEATWMTSLIGNEPSCLCAANGHVDSFADALCHAVSTLTDRQSAAHDLAERFKTYHNPISFLNALMG